MPQSTGSDTQSTRGQHVPTTSQARTTEEWEKFGQPGSTVSARAGNALAGWGQGAPESDTFTYEAPTTWPPR